MMYLLEIAMFQFLFLGVYYMFKNETFFNYNRAYLLITSCLSYVLPFIELDAFTNNAIPNLLVNELPTLFLNPTIENPVSNTTQTIFIWHWWYVPVLGSLTMLTIFVVKFRKLYLLSKQDKTVYNDSVAIINLKNSNTAFSFFNWVFIGDKLNNKERDIILEHELIHVKEKHSLDLMFFEIQRIVFWFNPMVYIYQNEIKAIHEYIVDQQMIDKKGTNIYCQNLLTQLFNTPKFTFVNTFYKQSLIKKRIAMITKKESKSRATLKYALIIPVITGMLFYTSCKSKKSQFDKKMELIRQKIDGVSFKEVQNSAVFPSCENAGDKKKCFSDKVKKYVDENFDTGLLERLGLTGVQRIAAIFKIDTNGNVIDIKVRAQNDELKNECIRVLNLLPKMEPAIHDGKKVNMLFYLPLSF